MRKRTFARITGFLLALLLTATGISWANSGYKNPVEVDWLNFTATLTQQGTVEMHWTPYNNTEDFQFYKVVRSTTNPDPVYPDDGYLKYFGNIDADSYTDQHPPQGTVYYRVCVITKNKDRFVSHVVTIENHGALTHINLTARYVESEKKVQLNWNEYEGSDFLAYKVYHADEGSEHGGINKDYSIQCVGEKEWELVATIDDIRNTSFADTQAFVEGTNFYKVEVVLEGNRRISSNEAVVKVTSEGNGNNGGNQEFHLSFTQSPKGIVDCCNCTITFSWKATGGSGNYRYQYRLAGYQDDSWSSWGTTTSASYQNLPQGSYTFMVIGEDMDQNKVTAAQKTFTVRCGSEGNGTIPTADISLYEHDLLGKRAIDLKVTTKGGTTRNTVDIYVGLVYPNGHLKCLILNENGIVLGPMDALQPLLRKVEMFDINDPITLYTYVVPDDAPKGQYLWVMLFTDSAKTFFNPDWIISYDMESFSVN